MAINKKETRSKTATATANPKINRPAKMLSELLSPETKLRETMTRIETINASWQKTIEAAAKDPTTAPGGLAQVAELMAGASQEISAIVGA